MGALSNNQKVFFELLRTGLWGGCNVDLNTNLNLDLIEDVKWNEVYQLAQEQSVQGLVLQGIEWFKNHNLNVLETSGTSERARADLDLNIPQILLLQWIGEVQVIEQQNMEMNAFIAELIEKLRENDVDALLVKGQGVAQCYEKPLWRCSGDVDLFLSDSNYEIAKRVLVPLASEVETEYVGSKHLGMTIDGWVVELHGSLYGGLSSRIEQELDKVHQDTFFGGAVRSWNNNGTQVFLLKAENDVFYVFSHILQHFFMEGIGLRQICDWCRLMWTYKDSLNYGLLGQRIKRAGLVSEWKAFGALAIEYLGFPKDSMPLLNVDVDLNLNANLKRKADRIMEFILKSGNMGHNRGSWLMEHDSWLSRQYVVRKAFSMFRRIGDLINHARIFPLDSLRFFPRIMFNGVRSAIRGE